jgi:hypothetical protein
MRIIEIDGIYIFLFFYFERIEIQFKNISWICIERLSIICKYVHYTTKSSIPRW